MTAPARAVPRGSRGRTSWRKGSAVAAHWNGLVTAISVGIRPNPT